MVQGRGQLHANALSTNPRVNHDVEGRAVSPCTIPGENIPTTVEPFPVDELVPTGDDIEWAVQRMRSNRSGGPSGIRTEHLQQWLREAQKAEAE